MSQPLVSRQVSTAWWRSSVLERAATLIAVALAVGYGLANLAWALGGWTLVDVEAYWGAALRLRGGEPLYPPFTAVGEAEVYRYAPWFAAAWIPLTYLPRNLVEWGWSAALLAACVAAIWPALRTQRAEGVVLVGFIGSFLFLVASVGNVQPLIVASLVWGLDRRSGPVWIAAAASLKATPLAFVAVYAARRQWDRVIATLALTAALTAPMLLFDLTHYTLDPGQTFGLLSVSPWAFALGAAGALAALAISAWRRSELTVLAAAVAAIMCLPRVFPYLFTYLLVPIRPGTEDRRP